MFDLITPETIANLLKEGTELNTLTGGAVQNTIRNFGAGFAAKLVARKQNRLAQNTKEKVAELGGMNDDDADTALLEPALNAALYEGREELYELWSTLIAKIMTRRDNTVRLSFIETLKKFDPEDALVLQHYNSEAYRNLMEPLVRNPAHMGYRSAQEVRAEIDYFSEHGLSGDNLEISKDHLFDLKCLTYSVGKRPELSAYGRALCAAVTMPKQP